MRKWLEDVCTEWKHDPVICTVLWLVCLFVVGLICCIPFFAFEENQIKKRASAIGRIEHQQHLSTIHQAIELNREQGDKQTVILLEGLFNQTNER